VEFKHDDMEFKFLIFVFI